jgi:L-lactate dehydrogenase complex protein LldG
MNVAMKHNTQEFIERASLVSARVYQVKDLISALDKALELCRSKFPCESQMETDQKGADPMSKEKTWIMAAPNLDEADFIRVDKACRESGDIRLIRENMRAYPGGIDMGITLVDFGIAETGTLVLNSDSEETRLSTMLCETHVAILKESMIRETALSMAEELNELTRQPFSYTAFITGASRTADIERVLALGVHGPLELVILLVEA